MCIKNKLRNVLFIFISVTVFILCILLTNILLKYRNKDDKKNAIIIVPGVGASALFYNGTDNKKYKPYEVVFLNVKIDGVLDAIKQIDEIERFVKNSRILEFNSDGKPICKDVGILKDPQKCSGLNLSLHKYGTNCMFKNIINTLEILFGKGTKYNNDIILFNYDWRFGCKRNGKLLAELIDTYDQVTVLSHSLGGYVSCRAMCELYKMSKLDKIKNYISVCVPYNGSVKSFYALKTGLIDSSFLFNYIYTSLNFDLALKNLIINYPSIYELLPTEEYFYRAVSYVKKNSEYIKKDDLVNYMKNSLSLNCKLIDKAKDFHTGLFIKDKHILDYVNNKYFIVGEGYDTPSEITIDKNSDFSISKYSNGDGTVELDNSAIPKLYYKNDLHLYKIKALHSLIFYNSEFINRVTYIIRNNI